MAFVPRIRKLTRTRCLQQRGPLSRTTGPIEERRVRGNASVLSARDGRNLTVTHQIVFHQTRLKGYFETNRYLLYVTVRPTSMRPRVDWMNQTDDRILELLDESDLILTPAVMARNLDYTRNWVSRRVGKLESAGLVEPVDSGYYRISDRGRAYLTGDLDADDLE